MKSALRDSDDLHTVIRWLHGQLPPWDLQILHEASQRFDLSPEDEEFLLRHFLVLESKRDGLSLAMHWLYEQLPFDLSILRPYEHNAQSDLLNRRPNVQSGGGQFIEVFVRLQEERGALRATRLIAQSVGEEKQLRTTLTYCHNHRRRQNSSNCVALYIA